MWERRRETNKENDRQMQTERNDTHTHTADGRRQDGRTAKACVFRPEFASLYKDNALI